MAVGVGSSGLEGAQDQWRWCVLCPSSLSEPEPLTQINLDLCQQYCWPVVAAEAYPDSRRQKPCPEEALSGETSSRPSFPMECSILYISTTASPCRSLVKIGLPILAGKGLRL